jgi:hypothetical protein
MYSRDLPARAGPEKVEARVAVRIQRQPARTDWRSEILFLLLTVGPWIVLAWLLWPRH